MAKVESEDDAHRVDMAIARSMRGQLCEGCPSEQFTNATSRCLPCPRRAGYLKEPTDGR